MSELAVFKPTFNIPGIAPERERVKKAKDKKHEDKGKPQFKLHELHERLGRLVGLDKQPRQRAFKDGNPNVGLIGAAVTPVELDYLTLGICVDPLIYWDLLAFFDMERVQLNERLYIDRKSIWIDEKEVGMVVGSQGAPSDYGRKIMFHFKGEFFRNRFDKPDDRGGEKLAFWLIRAVEAYIMQLPVQGVEERERSHYEQWLQQQIAREKMEPLREREAEHELLRERLALKQRRLWELRDLMWSDTHFTKDDDCVLPYKMEIKQVEEDIEDISQRLQFFDTEKLELSCRFFQYRVDELIADFARTFGRQPEFAQGWRRSVDKRLALAGEAQAAGMCDEAARLRHVAYVELLQLVQHQLARAGYQAPATESVDPQLEQVKRHRRMIEAMSRIRGKLFVNFTSIDRVDYAVNCEMGEAITPLEVACQASLLHGWYFSDSQISLDGISCYASSVKNPLAKRGTHPHLCVYQDKELYDQGLIRLEMRIPAVRSPSGNSGIEAAARLVAEILSCILARAVRIDDDPMRPAKDYDPQIGYVDSQPHNTLCVYPLDPGPYWAPTHVFRARYRGHAPDTVRRIGRMSVTMFERVVTSSIVAADFNVSTPYAPDSPGPDRVYIGPGLRADDVERVEQACLAWRRAHTPDVAPLAIRVRTSHVGTYPAQLAAPRAPARGQAHAVGWDGGEATTERPQVVACELRTVALREPVAPPAAPLAPAAAWWGGGLPDSLPPVFVGVEPAARPVELRPPRKNTLDSYLLDYEVTQELAAKAWVGRYKRPLPVALHARYDRAMWWSLARILPWAPRPLAPVEPVAKLLDAAGLVPLDYERQHEQAGRVPPIRDRAEQLVLRFPSHYSRSLYLREWARWERGERTRPPRWAVRAAPAGHAL